MNERGRLDLSSTPDPDARPGGAGVRDYVPMASTGAGPGESAGRADRRTPRETGPTPRDASTRTERADRGLAAGDAGATPDPFAALHAGTERIGALAADFASELSTLVRAAIHAGRVDTQIPATNAWFSLADGWAAKRVYDTPQRDIYVVHVQRGAPLPRHYKAQLKRIIVVSGAITLHIDGRDPKYLSTGEMVAIPAGVPHTTTGSDDESLLIVVYEPPFMAE